MTQSHQHPQCAGAQACGSQTDTPKPDDDNRASRWEERYASVEQLWSGCPNDWLPELAANWPPGSALEIGCGEGADVLWLAERGWRVTGLDLSATAIGRLTRQAERLGVASRVTGQVHDVGAGLPEGPFDLVTSFYVHGPGTPTTPGPTRPMSSLRAWPGRRPVGRPSSPRSAGDRRRDPTAKRAAGPTPSCACAGRKPRHPEGKREPARESAGNIRPTVRVWCSQRGYGGIAPISQHVHRSFRGVRSGSVGYIVTAAGRNRSRGLGSPLTDRYPSSERVLGSPDWTFWRRRFRLPGLMGSRVAGGPREAWARGPGNRTAGRVLY